MTVKEAARLIRLTIYREYGAKYRIDVVAEQLAERTFIAKKVAEFYELYLS